MLHVTNNTMKKTILIISASILFVFAATGCKDAYKVNPTSSNNNTVAQETDTPLGCDRANNLYYDFIETKKCLRPTTYEQLYILDKFRRINELASEDSEKVIEIQVNFKHYPTNEEFESILDNNVERVTYISMFYPNFANGTGFPSYIRDESITKDQAFQYVMRDNRKIAIQWSIDGLAEHYGEFDNSMLSDYQIQGVRLTMKQGDIPEWWRRHDSLIRVIQPIISDFDHVQTLFKPDETIGSEDQTINWEEM